ncbi:MAG: TetR/AcrR family transcriptional regulator [Streptosporangiales bacterium]
MTVAPEYSTDSGADGLWEGIQPEPARRLLVAGLGLFAAQGFHGTTTRDIAARAGMSPAALYVHYRTKEDLLFRISRIAHEAALTAIPPESSGSDPAGQLQAAVAAFTAWHARHHTAARVAQYELATLQPAHFRAVAAVRLAIERTFRTMIQRGVTAGEFEVSDTPATALAILSLAIDLARWYQPGSRHTPEELGELYAGLALRMVRSRR